MISKQIGQSTEYYLLYEVLRKLDRITKLAPNIQWSTNSISVDQVVAEFKNRVLGSSGDFEGETEMKNLLDNYIMTLYDKISWGLTGNGVKANQIYTFKPTDGNGDLAFQRATTTTRIDSNGNIEDVDINVPVIDWTSGIPMLSLNPSRTNLFLNSLNLPTQSVTVSAQAYTVSFWGTGTIDFTGAYVGSLVGTGDNDRVSITFTPTAGSLNCTVSGTVNRAQIESGLFASRYIPTTSGTVTRAADIINAKTGISNLIGQTEGTLYWEGSSIVDNTNKVLFGINDGTANNRVSVRINTSNFIQLIVAFGGSTVANIIRSEAIVSDQIYKVAILLAPNYISLFCNGVKVGEDLNNTIPQCSVISLGSEGGGGSNFYGNINAAFISKVCISEAEAISLTTI